MQRLGLDNAKVRHAIESLRWLWCSEPSVHGTHRGPLKALEEGFQDNR